VKLLECETLLEQLRRGPIAVEGALKLVLQVAEVAEAAHQKGVIHRELKPANICSIAGNMRLIMYPPRNYKVGTESLCQ